MTEVAPAIEERSIEVLYAQHVHEITARYSRALEQLPADAMLISSGDLIEAFLDEQDLPVQGKPALQSVAACHRQPRLICAVQTRTKTDTTIQSAERLLAQTA
jgi:hypothetical protein